MRDLDYYDYAALAVITSTIVLVAYKSNIYPIFVDIYYHLSIMQMFNQAGGVAAYDFLQYAPFGRPHLYPPLLHVGMLALNDIGISSVTIGKIVSASMYPLTLVSVWYFVREHFSRKAALFSLLLMASGSQFLYSTSVLSACALATICAIWTYHFILREKRMASIILFTFCLYSHISYPHLIALSLLLWAACDKSRRSMILTVLLGSYILATPWLLNVALNLSSISRTTVALTSNASLQLISLMLALGGCYFCYKEYKKGSAKYAIPALMLVAMVPIAIFYPSRFITHSAIPLSILGGICIGSFITSISGYAKNKKIASYGALCALVCVLLVGNVTVTISSSQNVNEGGGVMPDGISLPEGYMLPLDQYSTAGYYRIKAQDLPPPYQQYLPEDGQKYVINNLRIEWDRSSYIMLIEGDVETSQMRAIGNSRLLEVVLSDTDPEDIIVVPQGIVGAYITAYTGRATTQGMFNEVSADIKMKELLMDEEYETYMIDVDGAYFTVLDLESAQTMPSAVPSVVCYMLLIGGICVIMVDIFLNRGKNE